MSMQRDEQWYEDRRGKITGSKAHLLLTDGRGPHGLGAGALTYANQLAAERLGLMFEEPFYSYEMKRGEQLEDEARIAYDEKFGTLVQEVRFKDYSPVPYIGVSADGIVVKDNDMVGYNTPLRGVEIKCHNQIEKHLSYFLDGDIPIAYQAQMQWGMLVWDLPEWDFVSYDPRIADCPDLFVKRIMRDQPVITKLLNKAQHLNEVVEDKVNQIKLKSSLATGKVPEVHLEKNESLVSPV
ncbi:MAG: hypothetical protein CMF39_06390 [Legionellaceae bacterium]|nr:hypothetical protein [Legionellaceae bacterium]|tara:strand:- start:1137 stop:1853 length:717 start_codon:yes stop_codon:yes gene_type:complete